LNQAGLVVALKHKLQTQLEQALFTERRDKTTLTTFMAKIDFDKVLLTAAQRKALGKAPKHHDLYTDLTPEAVWVWELTTPSLYLEPASFLKQTLAVKESLSNLSGLIHALSKLQQLIHKAKAVADLTSVSTAHAKYIKLLQRRNEQTAKQQAKAMKE
jgi:hypothetical protein